MRFELYAEDLRSQKRLDIHYFVVFQELQHKNKPSFLCPVSLYSGRVKLVVFQSFSPVFVKAFGSFRQSKCDLWVTRAVWSF